MEISNPFSSAKEEVTGHSVNLLDTPSAGLAEFLLSVILMVTETSIWQ